MWETIAELYLAAWLKRCNIPFEHHTSGGADFLISFAVGAVLPLEVTAPRKTAIYNSLFERLAFLGGQLGFTGEIRHTRASYEQFSALTSEAARQVVEEQRELLKKAAAQADTAAVEQDYAEFGFTLSWRREPDPVFAGTGTWHGATAAGGFQLILDTLRGRHKRAQLSKISDPFGVVVEVGQAPDGWIQPLFDGLYRRDFIPDWSGLPAELRNLKYLIIYSVSLDRIPPFRCYVLINPDCPFPAPAGFPALQKIVFPEVFASDS